MNLDQELGNLVATRFPLNCNIFDVFDQFVNIIEKTIDLLERMSHKQRKLARKP